MHWLTEHVTGAPVTYLVVALAAGLDVLLPIVPSETIVITAAVLAARGSLSIWLIVPSAALGAFVGDNIAYWLGRGLGDPVARRVFRSGKAQGRLHWAERAIGRHGPLLIVIGRFIPGGRSASTFAAGTLGLGYRRFALADVAACVGWALYASLLGYLGGAAFRDDAWVSLGVPLGAAALLTLAGEVWRRRQRRRGRDVLGDELP